MARHDHRKERWLHTRITEDLEDALKREARRRRTPVSLLVRNVLESALDLVEDIVEDGLAIARRSQQFADSIHRSSKAPNGNLDEVYGWQELILNRAAACATCAEALQVGVAAHRGLREQAGPPVFLCGTCVQRLRQRSNGPKEERT